MLGNMPADRLTYYLVTRECRLVIFKTVHHSGLHVHHNLYLMYLGDVLQ